MKTKIIITLTVVIILILGFMFGKGDIAVVEEINETETSATTKYTQLKFPENNLDTSDWETYRNEDFGFEVRYPRDWEIEKRKEPFVISPREKRGVNDDGGVYFFSSKDTFNDLIKNINPQDSILRKRFINNDVHGLVFNTKLGVWDDNSPHPDTRKIIQTYVFDIGEDRVSFYVPSVDIYRIKVLEKILLSFNLF